MSTPTLQLAEVVLQRGDAIEDIRVYEFADDAEAHDGSRTEELYQEFEHQLDRVSEELSAKYGSPAARGDRDQADHELIPLNSIIRYTMWQVGEQVLYVAASHEDRGVPILLMMGSASGQAT